MTMKTGNQLLDELKDLNTNIESLNRKIDELNATMKKVEGNTKHA